MLIYSSEQEIYWYKKQLFTKFGNYLFCLLTQKRSPNPTVRKKMAAVHFTTSPCEPSKASKAPRKPNFYNIYRCTNFRLARDQFVHLETAEICVPTGVKQIIVHQSLSAYYFQHVIIRAVFLCTVCLFAGVSCMHLITQ